MTSPQYPRDHTSPRPPAAVGRGDKVRHLNPRLAAWRGTVTPDPANGQFLRSKSVHVAWDEGGITGWYRIRDIALFTDDDVAAMYEQDEQTGGRL